MAAIGRQIPTGREARQPWLRAGLFAATLAVSLALHAVLLFQFPVIPMRRPGAWPSTVPRRPLVMGEVRPVPDLTGFLQPEKFRPENPEAFADVAPLQEELLENLRAGAEELEFTPPPPAEAAVPPPASSAAAASWIFARRSSKSSTRRRWTNWPPCHAALNRPWHAVPARPISACPPMRPRSPLRRPPPAIAPAMPPFAPWMCCRPPSRRPPPCWPPPTETPPPRPNARPPRAGCWMKQSPT